MLRYGLFLFLFFPAGAHAAAKLRPPAFDCANSLLSEPVTLSWTGAFDRNGKIGDSQIFAQISIRTASAPIVSAETKAHAQALGLAFRLNGRAGAVYVMRDSHPFFVVPLSEPLSSIEFYKSGPDLGFLVLVGWTEIRYFVYSEAQFSETDVREFQLANRFLQPRGVKFGHLQVQREDSDEISIRDQYGNMKYLNSKQLKILLEELDLRSVDEIPYFHFATNLIWPGQHQLDTYLELQKLSSMAPAKLSDIYTSAALDVAHLRTPTFQSFFPPLVAAAFGAAFHGSWRTRFASHFAGAVEAASDFRLRRIPFRHDGSEAKDDPIARFRAGNGKEYVLVHSSSVVQPLRLMNAN
jgi:hypothetical protein